MGNSCINANNASTTRKLKSVSKGVVGMKSTDVKESVQTTSSASPIIIEHKIPLKQEEVVPTKSESKPSFSKKELTYKQSSLDYISPLSTNAPGSLSLHSSSLSTLASPNQLSPSTDPSNGNVAKKSGMPQIRQKKQISHLEIFILERKKYMQKHGIVQYTAHTILPPPRLHPVGKNRLYKLRQNTAQSQRSSLPVLAEFDCAEFAKKMNQQNQSNFNKLEMNPTEKSKGDVDQIHIEL